MKFFKMVEFRGLKVVEEEIFEDELYQIMLNSSQFKSYYVLTEKKAFPAYLEVKLEHGDLLIFIGQEKKPCWDNYDYFFLYFDQT
jgi:hypothetical protein